MGPQKLKTMSPEEIMEFHRTIFVANMHGDYAIEVAKARERHGVKGLIRDIHVPRMKEGAVDFEFYTVGGDDFMFTQDRDLTLGTFRSIDHAYDEIVNENSGGVLCLTADEILQAKKDGKVAFMFTIEGAGPIQEDLSLLRNFYRLGLRSVILTWFKANPSADGVGERRNGGLTEFGKNLIEEMDALGMLIDITQSAPQTIKDVFDVTKNPVIASHSNASGCYPHRRNLTDEQIRTMAERGGVIGITCYPAHVSNEPSIEAFMRHIDYCVNLADGVSGPQLLAQSPPQRPADHRGTDAYPQTVFLAEKAAGKSGGAARKRGLEFVASAPAALRVQRGTEAAHRHSPSPGAPAQADHRR